MIVLFVLCLGLSAVVPVGELAKDADLVVVARTSGVTYNADGSAVFSLMVESELKGIAPAARFQATLPWSKRMLPADSLTAKSLVDGARQLWFLRASADGQFTVIPAMRSDWSESDSSIKVDPLWTRQIGQSLEWQLLDATLGAFEAAPSPAPIGAMRLILSAYEAPAELALQLSRRILQNPRSIDSEVLGVSIALCKSSPFGLIQLKERLPRIQNSPLFPFIKNTLGDYYQPREAAEVRLLGEIALMQDDTSLGLDLAIARVLSILSRNQARIAVPGLVLLLDSEDPQARASAAHALHMFAALAGPNGEAQFTGRSHPHPFLTDETRLHSGNRKSIPLEASVAFWKSWWEKYKSYFSTI